jgi:hypothetical protein
MRGSTRFFKRWALYAGSHVHRYVVCLLLGCVLGIYMYTPFSVVLLGDAIPYLSIYNFLFRPLIPSTKKPYLMLDGTVYPANGLRSYSTHDSMEKYLAWGLKQYSLNEGGVLQFSRDFRFTYQAVEILLSSHSRRFRCAVD